MEDFNQQGSWLNSYRMKYVEYEPEKNWQLKMLHLPSRFRCIYSSLPTGLVIENINHVACWVCLVNLLGQGLILSFNWMKITKFNRYLFTSFVNLWSLFIILNYVWNLLCFDECTIILPIYNYYLSSYGKQKVLIIFFTDLHWEASFILNCIIWTVY